jgi:hypothetical protein
MRHHLLQLLPAVLHADALDSSGLRARVRDLDLYLRGREPTAGRTVSRRRSEALNA